MSPVLCSAAFFRASATTLRALCLLLAAVPILQSTAQTLYFPAKGEDWQTVAPASVGWNAQLLDQALAVAGERNSSGVVVLHNGRIMAEKYWEIPQPPATYQSMLQGKDAMGQAVEDVASAQKSVAAILTGIAQEKGLVDIHQPVSRYLGVGWSRASAAQEQDITLWHLLTMTSGLNEALEFEAPAGQKWFYNTPAYHFLMRALEVATGSDRNTFTGEWLTTPLGMENTRWTPRPWADAAIGMGLSTTARELARFGLLIHAGGRWQEQVLLTDQSFLTAMLSSSQAINPAYGYLWWLNGKEFMLSAGAQATRSDRKLIDSAPDDLVAMQGAQDRKLYIVPSLGLVIARLGATGAADGKDFNNAFWDALMQARPQ